jgi:hypothetical protein
MTDVRLTATTPDGEVVPVLSNTKGELLLEAPIAPPEFDGNLDGDLTVGGSSTFEGQLQVNNQAEIYRPTSAGGGTAGNTLLALKSDVNRVEDLVASVSTDGSALFQGDVVIGSRNKQWLIRESNGVAMLIEQTFTKEAPEKVRDLPRELDLIEAALNEVMEKLKMTPPAGWEVWDGSDNSR